MKIIIDTHPDTDGKFVYEIRNARGGIEIMGQGRTIGEAAKEAIVDYYDCFADEFDTPLNPCMY